MTHSLIRLYSVVLTTLLLAATTSTPAAAEDQIYFPATQNARDALVEKINAETERIDMAIWHLTEHSVSIALANRFNAGVPVRLIGDRAELFELNAVSKQEFYWLANQGVPIRVRFNPTWYPEINHWKATIFAGQKLVEFGSANYTPFELAPASPPSSTNPNYKDETLLFTSDPAIVNAVKSTFDRIWNDSTSEPQSLQKNPPYLKWWDDACATEPTGGCSDYHTMYPNPKTMIRDTTRLEPDLDPNDPILTDLIFGQGPSFNSRLIQEINSENALVRLVIYRLTVDDITNALLNKFRSGVPVQLMIEPTEYINRAWPEFWLTHANLDKLWAAGVPIKQRVHQGLTHMKTLVTSTYATNASSNFAAFWQRDIDYFIAKSTKPTIYQAISDRVAAMWDDSTAFGPFQPLPPDAPTLTNPISDSGGVATTTQFVWTRAAFAVSYDVYLGTSSSNTAFVGNVPAQLNNTPPETYSWTPSTPLQAGTTYFWKVVSRTNAAMVAESTTSSFTTTGDAPPPPPPPGGSLPSPWSSQDVGPVATAGSASYSNGVFTVQGAGTWIWDTTDSFRFVYQPTSGDTQIIAKVASLQNTSTFAKAGVMLRESLSPTSANVVLDVRPNGALEFMTRTASGATTTFLGTATQSPPTWLKLSRSGTTVTASVSANGSAWTTIGSTTFNIGSGALTGLIVCANSDSLNTATLDNVTVSASPGTPPPPPPSASDIVIYASDIPASARHGAWTTASDGTSPNGITLMTPDNGVSNTNNPLASPADYIDVPFSAVGGTPYRIWLRLRAFSNSKYNDSVWVQFTDATANGSAIYRTNTTDGLLVNLATSAEATSLNAWGWQNTAYWLSQPTTLTFPTTGTRTMRIQVREDGFQLDQIVLSPGTYLNSPPGGVTSDSTIVPKP